MVRLTIPALHSFRDLVLSAVSAAIDAAGGSPSTDVRDEIVSALSEAFNNVVIHAYRGVRGGMVEVSVDAKGPPAERAGEASVEIQIVDRGRPFEPLDVPTFVAPRIEAPGDLDDLDLDRLPESGMGLFIMRSFMDDVSYQRGGGGKPNILTLRKSWRRAEHADVERDPGRGVGAASPGGGLDSRPKSSPDLTPLGAESREQNASFGGVPSSKKESSRSGWRMRSVAVPSYEQSTVGSLKRK